MSPLGHLFPGLPTLHLPEEHFWKRMLKARSFQQPKPPERGDCCLCCSGFLEAAATHGAENHTIQAALTQEKHELSAGARIHSAARFRKHTAKANNETGRRVRLDVRQTTNGQVQLNAELTSLP